MTDAPAGQPAIQGSLPLYKKPEPINVETHKGKGLTYSDKPFEFLAETHFVPLTVGEFAPACGRYPIIFLGDTRTPVAAMGLRQGENLFVDPKTFEMERFAYLPAYVRRYPFVSAAHRDQSDRFTVCIDAGSSLYSDNPDRPFFTEAGEPTDFLNQAIEFVRTYEADVKNTQDFVARMRERSPADIAALMHVSDAIAELNSRRYTEWHTPFTRENAKQAVLAFRGDVYTGLEADRWNAKDFDWAQKHLRILSGLYGVLRPLDLIQPYRLEMGTRLPNHRGRDLYAFWRERVTESLAGELEGRRGPLLVNLASNEYFGAVNSAALPGRLVTPVFRDLKNGEYRIISFFAKKARGRMASWIVRNRVRTVEGLCAFAHSPHIIRPTTADLNGGCNAARTRSTLRRFVGRTAARALRFETGGAHASG